MAGDRGFIQRRISAQDGLEIAFRDYPPLDPAGRRRTPIVSLAGITRNSNDFDVPASHFRQRRRIIALDMRGRGASGRDPSGKSYQPETYLLDIHAVLTALNLGPAIFCGTSLGAFLTMGVAVLFPTAVHGAILNDASPVIDQSLIDRLRSNAKHLTHLRPKDVAEAKAALKEALAHTGLTLESDWDALTEGTYQPGPDGRLIATWDPLLAGQIEKAPREEELWPIFLALKRWPILLVRGGKSDFVTDQTMARMQTAHGQMSVVTVPSAGHSPTLKEPISIAAIDRYLEEIDG